MKIEIWSDVICPFCYIGKANLEQALAQIGGEADIVHRAFRLSPGEPVIPTTRVFVIRSRSSAARSSSARPVCGTSITVSPIPGRCTSAATAPREIASPTNA